MDFQTSLLNVFRHGAACILTIVIFVPDMERDQRLV
jgi:hypothetical protein